MKYLKLFSILILILLVVLLVVISINSVKADFNLEVSSGLKEVCPGSTIVISDIIRTSEESSFSITKYGSASSFSIIIPGGFYLNAGEKQILYSYITPKSTTPLGRYELIIKIESNGIVKEIKHEILVKNCHGLDIGVEEKKVACPCDTVEFDLKIKNLGDYFENYKIKIGGSAAKWANLSQETLKLESGKEKIIKSFVSVPCNIYGKYNLEFEVKATTSDAEKHAVSSLDIKPCYEFSLSTEKNFYEMCEGDERILKVKLKNIGSADTTYSLKLIGPSWIVLEKNTLFVKASEEKSVNLIVKPPINTYGSFNLTLKGISEYAGIEKKLDINFKIKKCYGASITLEKKEENICNGVSKEYNVKIKNIGNFTSVFDLTLDAPAWANLSEKKLELESSQEKIVKLNLRPPTNRRSGKKIIRIIAIEEKTNTKDKSTLVINRFTKLQCYEPELTAKPEILKIVPESASTIILNVKNNGLESAKYIFDLSGTGSEFVQINPSVLEIKPGETKQTYLYVVIPKETTLASYNILVNVKLKDLTLLKTKSIRIDVVKEILAKKPEEKTEINLLEKIKNFFINLFKFLTPKKIQGVNITNITGTKKENISEINVTIIPVKENFTKGVNKTLMNETLKAGNITKNITKKVTGNITNITKENVTNITINKQAGTKQNVSETNISRNVSLEITKLKEKFSSYKYYVIIIIIIIILIIIFSTGFGKKVIEFFEEEEKPEKKAEEEKKKKKKDKF